MQSNTYRDNVNVKRDGVEMGLTEEQLEEYVKCTNSADYFISNYVKIISLNEGLVYFKPYEYQKEMFKHFEENRFSIMLACRQSGKSIGSCAYLLWCAMFKPDTKVGVLANKGATAREMISRITLMLENVPFWLQPGCRTCNKSTIEFSNNSVIMSASTSSDSIRGFTFDLIYLDEFAFVNNAGIFYTSTYPVISAGSKSKVIITSTANGVGNMFHKIWESAIQGVSGYKPMRVDWWDVPGRDEAWKKETISNTSALQFEQEFGNSFLGTGDTLISAEILLSQKVKEPIFRRDGINIYYEPEDQHNYVMTVDVAKGRHKDYSTFTVIDITCVPWKQVATYRNNAISPILFPDIIVKYARIFNEATVVIESNDAGQVVCNGVHYEYEYENMINESSIKEAGLGVLMTTKSKRMGCSAIKDIIDARRLIICDEETIIEMNTFVAKKNSYGASDGNHDDLMMNLVMFGYFAGSNTFQELTQVFLKDFLFQQRLLEIENDLPPWGFVDDGQLDEFEIMVEEGRRSVWTVVDDRDFEEQPSYSNFEFL
jgi:hypothetical protein